jgi:hypothetical protein
LQDVAISLERVYELAFGAEDGVEEIKSEMIAYTRGSNGGAGLERGMHGMSFLLFYCNS